MSTYCHPCHSCMFALLYRQYSHPYFTLLRHSFLERWQRNTMQQFVMTKSLQVPETRGCQTRRNWNTWLSDSRKVPHSYAISHTQLPIIPKASVVGGWGGGGGGGEGASVAVYLGWKLLFCSSWLERGLLYVCRWLVSNS